MIFSPQRPRRLRNSPALRQMLQETQLLARHLVQPIFVDETIDAAVPVASMPGVQRHPLSAVAEVAQNIARTGVPAVILFGVPRHKDDKASSAYDAEGVVQQAVQRMKQRVPELLVMTDVCLCEYMSHGHCGIVEGGQVLNDPSLELLAKTAVSHAEAGADLVAPSDMMDGRVGVIRSALDESGFSQTPMMSYAVKYASAFYGPFRDAADSAPSFGDRKSYQMDPANIREALREATLDLEEGADILMVKPGLPYLDVLATLKDNFDVPLAAYQVSGEYAMLKAAAEKGWLDEEKAAMESLLALRRGGADLILTYYATQVAEWLQHV